MGYDRETLAAWRADLESTPAKDLTAEDRKMLALLRRDLFISGSVPEGGPPADAPDWMLTAAAVEEDE